jgi:hypothetical protein
MKKIKGRNLVTLPLQSKLVENAGENKYSKPEFKKDTVTGILGFNALKTTGILKQGTGILTNTSTKQFYHTLSMLMDGAKKRKTSVPVGGQPLRTGGHRAGGGGREGGGGGATCGQAHLVAHRVVAQDTLLVGRRHIL